MENIQPQIPEINLVEDDQVILLHTEEPPIGYLDFLGYMVCPLKHLFKEGLETVLHKYRKDTGVRLNCYVPMGCGGPDPYEDIWKVDNIDNFPDLIVSVGFDNLFKKRFMEEFIDREYFQAVQPLPVPVIFTESGIPDPEGHYTIYSIFPYIMLIDHRKLADRPVPRNWSDLLNPIYHRNIIIGGSDDEVNELLLIELYREGGAAALQQLADNVKDIWHASKMAKIAGTQNESGAAIYVLPWFFAKTCPRSNLTSIIWPEDGALASPMYLLVKSSKINRLSPLIQYVTGTEFGIKVAQSFFPVLNPKVENHLPQNAKFKWLGWEYIKSNPMEEVIQYTTGTFLKHWKSQN